MSTSEKLLALNFSKLTEWLQSLDFPLFPGAQLLCTLSAAASSVETCCFFQDLATKITTQFGLTSNIEAFAQ